MLTLEGKHRFGLVIDDKNAKSK